MDGKCSHCTFVKRICRDPGKGAHPEQCSTMLYPEIIAAADVKYDEEQTRVFAAAAACQEASCYDVQGNGEFITLKSRIQETIEFCKRMNYSHIGLAFCGGLQQEAAVIGKMLESHGLRVTSVMCKVGGADKTRLGIGEQDKIYPGQHETMCNPIAQALILNHEKTQFNVIVGLCVGHDSLFIKNSESLCTVLAVKDRLLGHNPLAAVYTANSYYHHLFDTKRD